MKRIRRWLITVAMLVGCQAVRESDEIRYRPVSRDENARAILAILKCLEQPGCETLLGDQLRCGPFLWEQLKGNAAVANLGTPLPFTDGFSANQAMESRRRPFLSTEPKGRAP